ncbi:glycosyltransferase family 2 protein [Pusillimonas minor]|uniref:Glycosyltransferase family 2 protein n=1 Tax=Pusillimonas minor TaxID=2697024 RepID=A0A842HNI3_9BURK|nr:glycosyltransferase family 2 protein [Pusillimonas minor]MBC2769843.1 glycosyltransferase family 2 protein [Pusillimonas minor]
MQVQTSGSTPLLGIVTVLYNSDDVLPGFFESLEAQEKPNNFRLYVIDNSTQDSGCRLSETLASRHNIDTQVHFNNANVGVAKGNNQGIELALADGCKQVLLANNDTEFGPDTLRLLQKALADGSERAATPKIMYHDKPVRLWYGGGHINPWTMRTPHYGIGQIDLGQCDTVKHVGYAPTCFMLLDATVLQTVGRMDEQYFVYYDDTDFVWRMTSSGIRISYVSNAVVLHKVSSLTGGGHSPFSVYYTNRNRIYFIRKNLRGFQKAFALCYVLLTRLPQLGRMPLALASRGWQGVKDGFKMPVPRSVPPQ